MRRPLVFLSILTLVLCGCNGASQPGNQSGQSGSQAPSFTLLASPNSLSINQGSSATSTITVTPQNGFTSNVSLNAANPAPGVTVSFNPVITSSTSVLTVTANNTAATSTGTITVAGSSESSTQTALITFGINTTPAPSLSGTTWNGSFSEPGVQTWSITAQFPNSDIAMTLNGPPFSGQSQGNCIDCFSYNTSTNQLVINMPFGNNDGFGGASDCVLDVSGTVNWQSGIYNFSGTYGNPNTAECSIGQVNVNGTLTEQQ